MVVQGGRSPESNHPASPYLMHLALWTYTYCASNYFFGIQGVPLRLIWYSLQGSIFQWLGQICVRSSFVFTQPKLLGLKLRLRLQFRDFKKSKPEIYFALLKLSFEMLTQGSNFSAHGRNSAPEEADLGGHLVQYKSNEKIYDVPMKFARKLIHGGQCTIAINQWRPYSGHGSIWMPGGQMVLSYSHHGSIWMHAGQMVLSSFNQIRADRVQWKHVFWPPDLDLWPMTLIF